MLGQMHDLFQPFLRSNMASSQTDGYLGISVDKIPSSLAAVACGRRKTLGVASPLVAHHGNRTPHKLPKWTCR
jgi:hypothetical protein